MREIAIIGFVQAMFFALLIISKRNKERKDFFLFTFLIFVGAELLYRYLLLSGINKENLWLLLFDVVYWGLFGPLILMYVLSVTGKLRRIRARHLLHLAPLIVGLFAALDTITVNMAYDGNTIHINAPEVLNKFAWYFWEFATPLYSFFALYILIRHRWSVRNYFSDMTGKSLQWLILLISGHALCFTTSYVIWFLVDVMDMPLKFRMIDILPAVMTGYVFFIGYFGYRQTGVFFQAVDNTEGSFVNSRKYSKSGLTASERDHLVSGLKELMSNERPYIECDLTISDLAAMLDTDTHKLSQVINESFQKNFYDFINSYRIEESKRLLRSPGSEKLKIIAIAYDSGFSTKSAFYNAFRKNTGITPGEYQKKFNSIPSNSMLN